MQYLRFYNLRNYDRINTSSAMSKVEQQAGVSYDEARMGHDVRFGQAGDSEKYGQEYAAHGDEAYQKYQTAAQQVYGGSNQALAGSRWDSVAECYMLGGEDIRNVPWEDGDTNEVDAFVSEELYIHLSLIHI